MKVNLRQLKRIIRETIEEVATPGDDRYSIPGDARGGVRGGRNSRGVTFPGHADPASAPSSTGLDPNLRARQGLGSPSGSYQQGVGWVPGGAGAGANQQGLGSPSGSYQQGVGWVPGGVASAAGDAADDAMSSSSDLREEFFLLIDSQVTRGKQGNIEHVPSGNIFTVDSSNGMLDDLNMAFQKSGRASSDQRSKEIIKILMDYDLLGQQDVDSELMSEIGIKGRDSGQIWPIQEYFMEYNNRFITECKRAMRKILR